MSPFFLQGRALGPPLANSSYNKEKMENNERTLYKSTQGVRWIIQCNGAHILLTRMESSRE
jgi:hypothetical protein